MKFVSKDLTKKAVELLLQGATMLKEPCPYCSGVRIMKEGKAFCVSCGREPEKRNIPKQRLLHMGIQLQRLSLFQI